MANMSYCRFQNTVIDLQDCYDALSDPERDGTTNEIEPLSREEERAKRNLITLCEGIVEEFGEED